VKHLEPNIKVNEMKGKNKPISLIFMSLLVFSTLVIVYTPTVSSGSFKPMNKSFYGTLTPQVVTAGYNGKQVNFQFSITSNTTTGEYIDFINVTLPEGWTTVSAQCNTTWTPKCGTGYVNFTASDGNELVNGSKLFFNITASVLVGKGNWTIDCYYGTEPLGTVTETVLVTPYFDAKISPSIVKSGYAYVFELKITHNTTLSSIYQVAVQYPSPDRWSFRDIVSYPQYWVFSHNTDTHTITFTATGGNLIAPGKSAIFSIEMNLESGASDGDWNVTAVNTAMQEATTSLTVDVDDTAPTVSITAPTDSARVHGNVWINASITETNLQSWVLKINGTQITTGTTATIRYLWNTLTYTDGTYIINITATDVVGNIGYKSVSVIVDNTAPQLLEIKVKAYVDGGEHEYTPIGNTIWIPNATNIQVIAIFLDASGPLSGSIYFNMSSYSFANNTWLPTPSYSVAGVTSIPVKINITDSVGNRFVQTWYVRKDFNPPSAPTYTRYQLICGGIIIWGINATDAESLVVGYNVYINGTEKYITTAQLVSTEWLPIPGTNIYSFSGALVLNLTGAQWANITIATVDGAGNKKAAIIYAGKITKGTWYPVELYPEWNLISLPLVPANSSINNVLSLLLKEGLLESVWTYDAETKTWHSYAPGAPPDLTTMVDGKGYFIKVKAYNVLIVQGTEQPAPPATPRVYHVVPGWNLIGYKRLAESNVSDYLSGVDYIRVYTFINGQYILVRPDEDMEPGLGYWVAVKTEGWIYP
jgi:hypothetical protein